MITFSIFLLQGDDRGKAPVVDQITPSSRKQVYIIVIFEIEHEKCVILLCLPQYIAFILVMFYILLLQYIDLAFDIASDK